MEDESYGVNILNSNHEKIRGTFFLAELPKSDLVSLKLNYSDRSIEKTASDYFEGMCDIRRELERAGLLLECYGGSKNVYPSSMSRGMGAGMKAYKLNLGIRARMSDLVLIFETGTDVEPATVEEQHNFFQLWLRSLTESNDV